MGFDLFSLGDVALQSGQILPDAKLAYKTYGSLNADRNNAVLLPTFYTGTHKRNEGFFGTHRAINPEKHFIVSINMFGNGLSSSPSNAAPPADRGNFPAVTLYDNVQCQKTLLESLFGIEKLLLVTGWSVAGCQAFQWAAQFPDYVSNILPFCASARVSPHNWLFLEGVKTALMADPTFNDGFYEQVPESGLKAFATVYAGWAYSQSWYRDAGYQKLGFRDINELLLDWEQDHLTWDANDLLAKLATWQNADISQNDVHQGNLNVALRSICAKTIIIACDNDLYFQPADNELEVQHIQNGELRVYESPWGHCVASPNNDPQFHSFLDQAITDLTADPTS
tara:strand:- start:9597 stop:10613 length:1017 start_codon:yes stop_codon:yes gene_type:complete